jgi:hypothetical protein
LKRPNVIVVGVTLVSAAVLSVEVCTVVRSRRAGQTTANATSEAPDVAREATPPPARQSRRPFTPPPGAPPLPSFVAPAVPGSPLASPRNAGAADPGRSEPSAFFAPTADGARRNADEMVFTSLQLDADTRAAILQINEAFNAKLIALRNAAAVNGTDDAATAAATQTRRDALRQLLGAETAARFEAGEQVAFGRLQLRRR